MEQFLGYALGSLIAGVLISMGQCLENRRSSKSKEDPANATNS